MAHVYRSRSIETHGSLFRVYLQGQKHAFPSLIAAKSAIDEHCLQVAAVAHAMHTRCIARLDDAISQFLTEKRLHGLAAPSMLNYMHAFQRFQKDNPRIALLHEITIPHWHAWMEKCHANSQRNTKHSLLVLLRALVKWGHRNGKIVDPAFCDYDMPTGNELAHGARQATDEEVRDILHYTENTRAYHAVILAISSTGIRPSELARIPKDAYHPTGRHLDLHGSQTKNKKDRKIPIINDALHQYLIDFQKINAGHPFLFVNSHSLPWTAAGLFAMMCRIKRKHGLPEDLSLYSFRKYACNALCEKITDIRIIYGIMGHSPYVHDTYYQTHTDEILSHLMKSSGKN